MTRDQPKGESRSVYFLSNLPGLFPTVMYVLKWDPQLWIDLACTRFFGEHFFGKIRWIIEATLIQDVANEFWDQDIEPFRRVTFIVREVIVKCSKAFEFFIDGCVGRVSKWEKRK